MGTSTDTTTAGDSETGGFRESLPGFALGMTGGLLVVPIVRGSAAARWSAIAVLLGTVGGVALFMLWTRRVEYGDDRPAPGFWDLMGEALQGAARSLPFWAVWGSSLLVIIVAPGGGRAADRPWLAAAVALLLVASIVVGLVVGLRGQLSGTGVEAEASRRSAVTAFFTMAVLCAAWAVLEGLLDAPRLWAWIPASIGILVWQVGYWVHVHRAAA